MTDREIIEWVANAQVGQALPTGVSGDDIMLALQRAGGPVHHGMVVDGPKLTAWAKGYLAQRGRA